MLLIDEVDRLDIESEALLLEVLSDYQVSIPEFGTVTARHIPQVFLTSNNSRDLSEALKRRCLFLHLGYPSVEREAEIVRLHVPELAGHLATEIAELIALLRQADLKKPPSIAESLDWARTLLTLGATDLTDDLIRKTLSVLLKYERDIDTALASCGSSRRSPDMQEMLAALVDELRSVGIGVSVGEHLDAAQALSRISLWDKDVVRAALLSALIKRAEHVETVQPGVRAGDGVAGRQPGAALVEAMSDEQLADTLRAGDRVRVTGICCGCWPMSTCAGSAGWSQGGRSLACSRPSRSTRQPTWPGSAMRCSSPVRVLLTLKDLEARAGDRAPARGRDRAAAGPAGCAGGWPRRAPTGPSRTFRAELRAAVRRALVADRGAQAVRETMRVELAEDIDIVTASATEQRAMAAAIGPMAQRLTHVLARLAVHRRRTLSIRRTMQRAMGTGGVPFRLVTEPAQAAEAGDRRAGRHVGVGGGVLAVHAGPAGRAGLRG